MEEILMAREERSIAASQERWLRRAFLAGAVTDGLALVPMLIPAMARLFWGFDDQSGAYRFAMGYGGCCRYAGEDPRHLGQSPRRLVELGSRARARAARTAGHGGRALRWSRRHPAVRSRRRSRRRRPTDRGGEATRRAHRSRCGR